MQTQQNSHGFNSLYQKNQQTSATQDPLIYYPKNFTFKMQLPYQKNYWEKFQLEKQTKELLNAEQLKQKLIRHLQIKDVMLTITKKLKEHLVFGLKVDIAICTLFTELITALMWQPHKREILKLYQLEHASHWQVRRL